MFKKYLKKETWCLILSKNIDNFLENFIGLALAIVGIWFAIYTHTDSKFDSNLKDAMKDFSDIATMNEQRIARYCIGGLGLSTEKYKRTLQLNYKLHSDFIINKLDYEDFSKYWNITEQVNRSNECDKIKDINAELDKLFDKLVASAQ